MTDDSKLHLTYAKTAAPLDRVLARLKRPGDFFCIGTIETPMPLFEVKDVGILSFPVPPEQCRRLIRNVAERAPYGRGNDTLIDESVRRVWQIPTARVSIGGKHWESALATILKKITAGLGCPESSLMADFYKMLVYETGGFFLAHRDTEKAPGMVGTLVIFLPSAHSGGQLVIRHDGRETIQELNNLDPATLRFASFYADCEHEVRPITDGYRVCLVYNLIQAKKRAKSGLQPPDTRPILREAIEQLKAWSVCKERSAKLVYLLEHRYTEAALSFAVLKGRDAALAEVLKEAARESACAAHLGLVHIEDYGWAEYEGDYHRFGRRRRSWDDDPEEDQEDFSIGEVTDGNRYINHWRDIMDTPAKLGEIPLEDDEILPIGALEREPPDVMHFSEATGNEGASFERTYLRAALVIWPQSAFDTICASAGIEAALARLGQRVKEALSKKDPRQTAASRESIPVLAALIRKEFQDSYPRPGHFLQLVSHLARFGDVNQLEETCAPLIVANYDGSQNKPLFKWASLVGPTRFAEHFAAIMRREREPAKPHPDSSSYGTRFQALSERVPPPPAAGCMDLWTGFVRAWKRDPAAKRPLADLLRQLLTDLATARPPERFAGYPLETDREKGSKPVEMTPSLLVRFLSAVEAEIGGGLSETALLTICANPTLFSPENLILSTLETEETGDRLPPKAAAAFWRHCADQLLQRAATPPATPTNWTQPLTEDQISKLRSDLKAFALDPNKKEIRFSARKELRQAIHNSIDSRKLDMTHVTERKGRPYTLVCKKTLGHYQRACRQYEADFRDMKRLLARPESKAGATDGRTERLREAVTRGSKWKPLSEKELRLP